MLLTTFVYVTSASSATGGVYLSIASHVLSAGAPAISSILGVLNVSVLNPNSTLFESGITFIFSVVALAVVEKLSKISKLDRRIFGSRGACKHSARRHARR